MSAIAVMGGRPLGQGNDRPRRPTPDPVAILWARYVKLRDLETRNLLVEHYLPMVDFHAARVHVKLPDEVQLDDLRSSGAIGLMEAVERFDPSKGVLFATFAAPRVRGAIMDHLREMDWAPRLQRSRAEVVRECERAAAERDGYPPTIEELASAMKVKKSMVEKKLQETREVEQVSLSRKWFETDNSSKSFLEEDNIEDKGDQRRGELLAVNDWMDWLCVGMSRKEKLIVALYHFEELTMKETGAAVGISKSRVSQMHGSILKRMKARISGSEKKA